MIYFGRADHGRIISQHAGVIYNPAADRCISRVEGGALAGGVTYQGYTGASIHMHMAGFQRNWANRDFLWVAFDYPFNQLNCGRVFGQIRAVNSKALEIVARLGFKEVARIDHVFDDGACVVVALARDDCRWVKLKPRGLVSGSEK